MQWPPKLRRAPAYRQAMTAAWEAAAESPDPSSQNGAIILANDHVQASRGFNHVPNVSAEELADMPRDEKHRRVIHAEHHAISEAWFFNPASLATLVALWAPCRHCASTIIMADFTRLVVNQRHLDLTPERWTHEVAAGTADCQAAGIEVMAYHGPIDSKQQLRFDGMTIHPRYNEGPPR